MRHGSFFNKLMDESRQPAPEVGMAATILCWTDRHAATVVRVSASGKTVWVKRDRARRIDKLGLTDSGQKYEYTPDTDACEQAFRLTKKGWRGTGGGPGLALGFREEYHDPSF